MQIQEFEALVLEISAQTYCRHWLHWNQPETTPILMALTIFDCTKELQAKLESAGFKKANSLVSNRGAGTVFVIERSG